MPKGVEHLKVIELPSQRLSVESLMPKGVEHKYGGLIIKRPYCVESLMPKGVEHNAMLDWKLMEAIVSNL